MLDAYVARDSDSILGEAIKVYSTGNQEQAYEMLANVIVEDQKNQHLPLTIDGLSIIET